MMKNKKSDGKFKYFVKNFIFPYKNEGVTNESKLVGYMLVILLLILTIIVILV